ncbi:DUF6036 family nucleotidyltransferase [Dyadobacter sp. CY312]|uniref:DUF6036 family nucleotidyltransferase n=1 Tax=Dyadobacter sp. CY312 TaxID=2907303 RepID=UPI001F2D71AA|nr:DUF6036 family nucleotidyltransferase [Dyadobacter sp. CY312]MCE7041861.1 hypothetical protein [Dyadobacter sp. CY312]
MDLENDIFLDFTRCAEVKKLEYMVIGGFAMFLNGLNRATNDIDIWMKPTEENGQRLIEVLLCMGYDEEDLGKLIMMKFTESQVFGLNNELDILTYVHHKFDFDTLFTRSRKFENAQKSTIHFLHLNDLRELKILARRPQDLRDVVMIDDFLEIKNKGESEI